MSATQFQAPTPEELHAQLPAYHVAAFLAQGGMGAVYRAHQKSLERDVAIKILPREFQADEEFRHRFEAEAKAMARLNHPNLIGVYDFGEVNGMPYIVMEFVDGKSLHHSAHGMAIEQNEAARLVLGICEGLAHAHEAGILHRDVKPANILLDRKAHPKIGDFGLACAVGSGDDVSFGTPGYSAPEVIKNSDAVGKPSDVYASGVILHELLTGELPGDEFVPVSQIADVDPRFDRIIRRATHPSPTLRYADAGAMAKELSDLQSALAKRAVGTGLPARPQLRESSAPVAAGPASSWSPPTPQIKPHDIGYNWTLFRNLVIIVILLAAIFGMTKAYQWKKDFAEAQARAEPMPAIEASVPKVDPDPKPEPVVANNPQPTMADKPESSDSGPEPPKLEGSIPEKESITQALTRLKPGLLRGDYSEMPEGAARRGESHFMLVEQALDWTAASRFAEEHGAHLAVLETPEDLAWIADEFDALAPLWLGLSDSGTEKKWVWVNGSAPAEQLWAPGQPDDTPSEDGGEDFAALLPGTNQIADFPGPRELPFLLQWTNTDKRATLSSQLERTAADLKARRAPLFPAGTRNIGGSRFLLVAHQGSWEEASALATAAGGHLAVPSSSAEARWIADTIRTALGDAERCWIGASLASGEWKFVTGERFDFVEWAPGQPAAIGAPQQALQVAGGANGGTFGYGNAPSSDQTRYYLLEWSVPSRRNMPKAGEVSAPADVTEWLLRHRENTQKIHKDKYERFQRRWAQNVEDFIDDILRETETARNVSKEAADYIGWFTKDVEEQGKVPAALGSEREERFIGAIRKRAYEEQEKIRKEFQPDFELAKNRYLDAVKACADALMKQGNREGAGLLTREHEATNDDRFHAILRGEFPAVP